MNPGRVVVQTPVSRTTGNRGRTWQAPDFATDLRVGPRIASMPASPPGEQADSFRLSRWRSKCFRPCEVNTIDYLAHPTDLIWVTASG